MAEAQAKIDRPLDEVMQAMDVVDTLRHRANMVERELGVEERDDKLIERLREIYRNQGIDVPDSILKEGVAALKEGRFAYDPPRESFSVKLARLYIARHRWGKWLLIAIGLLLALIVAWYVFVERPRIAAIEADRRELAEVLPRQLETLHEQTLAAAKTAQGRNAAETWYREGVNALAAKDASGARAAADKLGHLLTNLRTEYALTIISRQGESSGVWRIPDVNPDARNYYVIVEALDENGRALTLNITNEEDGKTYRVDKWGVRVTAEVFDRIRRDKSDDGIIQNNRIGVKRRGYLEPEYLIPVGEGRITTW